MRFLLLVVLLFGCNSNLFQQKSLRIGVDPTWYFEDFGAQTSYVNGYIEDLLLEMAQHSGMEFELVRANWDSLLDGIWQGKYEAIFTTLPPYETHLAKYDFSPNILDIGPILIISYNADQDSLKKLDGDLVGIIANDPAELILEKNPTIIIRSYPTTPDLLNAVAYGNIQGALMGNVVAINYVGNLYKGVLQTAGTPLTDQGIHLIGPKGKIDAFNKHLKSLIKKGKLEKLQKKWQLAI